MLLQFLSVSIAMLQPMRGHRSLAAAGHAVGRKGLGRDSQTGLGAVVVERYPGTTRRVSLHVRVPIKGAAEVALVGQNTHTVIDMEKFFRDGVSLQRRGPIPFFIVLALLGG